jgi:voltage-gated potassium channel
LGEALALPAYPEEGHAVTWIDRLTSPQTRVGWQFDRLIYFLIITSLFLFALETVPSAQRFRAFFVWSERIIVAIFTVEYALRTIAKGLKYNVSFLGVIDLVAILPFYVSLGMVDLRTIRICRLFRLLRLAKLHRYNKAWDRLRLAFSDIKNELAVFCGITVALVYLSSVGIYYCEHEAQPDAFASVFDAMWWAIATLTTVGYGDVYPVTLAGRLFTFLILILGLGVVSVPSALIASALVKQHEQVTENE